MLDALLAGGCARLGIPGAQLGLLRDGRREVLCAGVLEAGRGDPVLPSTPFHAGSITKPLAATLALDAAARGEVDLGAPGSGGWDDPLAGADRPHERPAERAARGRRGHPRVRLARGRDGPPTPPRRFAYCNAGWAVVDLALEAATGIMIEAEGEGLRLAAPPMGIAPAVRHVRSHGDTFVAEGEQPGGMAVAFDDGLLYLGPFALPRAS